MADSSHGGVLTSTKTFLERRLSSLTSRVASSMNLTDPVTSSDHTNVAVGHVIPTNPLASIQRNQPGPLSLPPTKFMIPRDVSFHSLNELRSWSTFATEGGSKIGTVRIFSITVLFHSNKALHGGSRSIFIRLKSATASFDTGDICPKPLGEAMYGSWNEDREGLGCSTREFNPGNQRKNSTTDKNRPLPSSLAPTPRTPTTPDSRWTLPLFNTKTNTLQIEMWMYGVGKLNQQMLTQGELSLDDLANDDATQCRMDFGFGILTLTLKICRAPKKIVVDDYSPTIIDLNAFSSPCGSNTPSGNPPTSRCSSTSGPSAQRHLQPPASRRHTAPVPFGPCSERSESPGPSPSNSMGQTGITSRVLSQEVTSPCRSEEKE